MTQSNMFILFLIVPLGSIPVLPAESCKEIKASEEGKAVSGKNWLNIKEMREAAGIASMTFPVRIFYLMVSASDSRSTGPDSNRTQMTTSFPGALIRW